MATLPLLEYERCRETEAEKLGIKLVSILDKLVGARRPSKRTPPQGTGKAQKQIGSVAYADSTSICCEAWDSLPRNGPALRETSN